MAGDESNIGWAVVTGASSGIGLAFARELSRRGHPVLAVARRRERLDALSREATQAGRRIEPLAADLTTDAGIASVVRSLAELGSIDLLINNAGVATAGDFLQTPLAGELDAIRLNVEAVVALTQAALGDMVRRGRGSIINIASVTGFQPFPHFAVYAASKAFVLCFTEAIAEEVKGAGVRVLALCPGAAKTEMDVFSHNEGLLGRFPSLTPDEVARAGLRALEDGRVVKIVGSLNRMMVFMNRLLPRGVVRWMMGVSVKTPSVRTAAKLN